MVKEVQGLIAAGFQQRQSIKGRTAFPGKVTGRVCLVRGKADLPRVQLGDVLVAKTTMPDYTPAMKLAAAFVTEEGGITSHAAIISREWKKPCVVGTGNCTKLLQDGDVVEVDAEQGIVRKI
jgi:pyruvate,water dikinase